MWICVYALYHDVILFPGDSLPPSPPTKAASIGSHTMVATPLHSSNQTYPGKIGQLPRVVNQHGDHLHAARLFVGPMPMKVAAPIVAPIAAKIDGQRKAKHWWLLRHQHDQDSDEAEDVDKVPEGHALRYFLHLGGDEEEWESEDLRKRTKHEMLRQWRKSGWDPKYRQKGEQDNKWVGQTFQVGTDFLGVPMQTAEDARSRSLKSAKLPDLTPQASSSKIFSAKSYHTARDGLSEGLNGESSAHSYSSERDHGDPKLTNGSGVALLPKGKPSSPRRSMSLPRLLSVPSIASRAKSDGQIRRPTALPDNGDIPHNSTDNISFAVDEAAAPRSSSRRLRSNDVKGKAVQFSSVAQQQEHPAPPGEVLSRRPSKNPDTSDGAAAAQVSGHVTQTGNIRYGDVVLSDRMLVRRSRIPSGAAKSYFDAEEAMKVRNLRNYGWKEYLVVWRKGELYLYQNYSIPGKEMILGHKHLAFVIPLQKPDTNLSVYSFTDFTFCLTCTALHEAKDRTRRPTSLSAKILFLRDPGTDIFVFKGKTRSRSIDWVWNIWRWLGNEIPRSFDVYCPVTENCIRLPVPDFDEAGGEGYKIYSRDHVVGMCRAALKHNSSWDYLMESHLGRGARLELCWRKEAMLDWVRWEKDAQGNKRDWAVLYGLCLNKPHEIIHLEVRIAEHHPTSVVLSNGTHLQEPPAVEGYLYRIKPFSQTRIHVYVSTHNGCLFLISPSRAEPPHPPMPIRNDTLENNKGELPFWELEVQRGTKQILQADVFIDVQSIAAVRRAFQVNAPSQHLHGSQEGETNIQREVDVGQTAEDQADEGGDAVLSQHPDGPKLNMRRSFELLMKTGNVVRFEAYSCAVALEWITHINRLMEYWKHRRRIDAREEMDLIHAVTGNGQVVLAHPDKECVPKRPPNYDQPSDYLPSFWDWCVLDGCLSMIKNGRLYLKKGFRGQYTLMQLVLVSGHLIQFRIVHGTAHHLRSKTTSLLDAYVCSGHFAVQSLPRDEFLANRDPIPRRFHDGLETDDPELEKVLVVWYRPSALGKANAGSERGKSAETTMSPLNPKRKILVLKARSRLERNAWCWALNAEIERISRRHPES